MNLFRYNIWFDVETDVAPFTVTNQVERTYLARTEGDAFAFVERDYPTWYSVELVHSMPVRGRS